MIRFSIVGALLLLTGATVMAEETTSVQNGTNSATVTQSGPSGDTQRSVERSPGRTRIEQRSGSNSATIIQDGTPGAADQDDDDLMPAPKPAPRPQTEAAPRGGPNVYDTLHERASPQGQANLDRLMNTLGLSASGR